MAINRSKIGEAVVSVHADNNPLTRGLKLSQRKLRDFGGALQGVGRSAVGVGGSLFRMVGAAALPFGLAIRSGMQFQDTMSEVGAVTQASTEQLKALNDQAKLLGRTTSFTASEVGSGQAELGRAGFNPEEIQAAIPHVLDLARATKTELAVAAGIAAASLRQFGMDASETQRIADALTTTANKSFTTLESIGESLEYAGPVASDFNMSIEETLALVGALGNVGIQGSSAGTALRRLLTVSGAEAEKLKDIFGVDFASGGNARKLIESLAEVNEATKGLGTADRAAKFNEAFGLLGITGASAISKNVADVSALFDALQNGEGTARTVAQAMDDNLGGSFRMMMSAVEGVAIAITEAATPALRMLMDGIQSALGIITPFIEQNKQIVVQFMAGLAAMTALAAGFVSGGVAIGLLGMAISGVGTAFGVISTVLGALASPLGIAIGLATALGTTMIASSIDISGSLAAMRDSFTSFVDLFRIVGQGLKDAFDAKRWDLAGKIAIQALKVALWRGFVEIVRLTEKLAGWIAQMTIDAMTGKFLVGGVESLAGMKEFLDALPDSEAKLKALLKEANQAATEAKELAEAEQLIQDMKAAENKTEASTESPETESPETKPPAAVDNLATQLPTGAGAYDYRMFLQQLPSGLQGAGINMGSSLADNSPTALQRDANRTLRDIRDILLDTPPLTYDS